MNLGRSPAAAAESSPPITGRLAVPTTMLPPPSSGFSRMPLPNTQQTKDDGAIARSVLSLLICIHLFCVAVVLSSNFRRSALQARLVSIFAGYTKLLHFDPEFTPYYYTLGRTSDDDTWLTIDLYPSADQPVGQQQVAKTIRLPDGGSNLFENRARAFQLAKLLAMNAEPGNDNDDLTGEIARSVGGWAMRTTGNHRAVVRCIRRMSQPYDLSTLNPGFPADRPKDPTYEAMLYDADVWTDEDGQVQVLKRASRAEVAPRQSGTSPTTAPAADPTNK
jgi:hypothetical protein